ncbi:MAG TPA: ECF-type sigma factor [Bryobacteraceae bacterium]|nr:ECF-type sigma factor [Bryobacteraceae bacterium]
MSNEAGDITVLLQKWQHGSRTAENELFALVMPNLRRLAHYMMGRERKGHTLQPTELINQIYFRLVAAKNRDWRNRQHFFAIAGRAMRRYLIDHARGKPDAEIVALEGIQNLLPADSAKLDLALNVDRLLNEMAAVKPEWCTLVEVKYFLGLNDDEAAEALGLKLRSMQRMWHEARQWLFERIETENARQSARR